MLKFLGALLILSVGGLAAFISVEYEKKRLSVVDGWIDLISYIRGQINCYLMPLGDILSGGDRALFEACMSPSNAADLPAILDASGIYLDGDGKRIIESFHPRHLLGQLLAPQRYGLQILRKRTLQCHAPSLKGGLT